MLGCCPGLIRLPTQPPFKYSEVCTMNVASDEHSVKPLID